jgi:uncharacterized PurR-regulated membrane protein YhhQ (DUF165 family)
MTDYLSQHQLFLWILTVFTDLGFAVQCYRLFGRTGLYGVIIFSLLLANIMVPKLTVIAGMRPAGVICGCAAGGAKYVFKFAIAVIDTPFIYLACRWKSK